MKKYIPLIFILLFPYVPILILFGGGPVELLLIGTAVMFLLALIASVICLVCAIRNKWPAEHLALANMIIKILHIPAYLFTFVVGVFGLISVKFIAITLFMFLFDCVIIGLSGMVALSGVIRARAEQKISTGHMVLFGISSFMFCIDVISAIILYITMKKANRPILQEDAPAVPDSDDSIV